VSLAEDRLIPTLSINILTSLSVLYEALFAQFTVVLVHSRQLTELGIADSISQYPVISILESQSNQMQEYPTPVGRSQKERANTFV